MNVSGAWRGVRRRPERSLDTPFYATLVEDPAGKITGMIEEVDVDGLTDAGTLYSTIDGHRRDDMVIFVTTAENAVEPQRPVQYVGATSARGGAITGAWVVATVTPANRSGTFEMEKVADGMAEAEAIFTPLEAGSSASPTWWR